jgi:CRP-like cAMP-binding protein
MADTASELDRLSLLGQVPLLKGLPPGELRRIAESCRFETVAKGAIVFTPESHSRDAYLVLKGRLRIVNVSLSGREVAYAAAGPGEILGELSAIDGEARSATVAALEPCLLAALAPDSFLDLLARHPPLALGICRKLAHIVRHSNERIMDLATLSAYQRVYSEVLKLIKSDPVRPNSWLVYPLPTQAQIASLASTTRETVARVLSQLTHAGLCERKGRTLYVRDLARLRALSERLNIDAA